MRFLQHLALHDSARRQWDASGDVLAVLPAGCSFVYTWTASSRDLQKLETDFRVRRLKEQQLQLPQLGGSHKGCLFSVTPKSRKQDV